ncbi:MAG: HTH domain-containing protein [bacterium]|nr:HTH domain-containing protein [bacterium]
MEQLKIETKLNVNNSKRSTIGLIKSKRGAASFRFRVKDMDLMDEILERLNDASTININKINLMRGLLSIANETDSQTLLDAIARAHFNVIGVKKDSKKIIIDTLNEAKGGFVPSGKLCKKTGLSRQSIFRKIHQLKNDGVKIETARGVGYRIE